jgi:hypothetical protein
MKNTLRLIVLLVLTLPLLAQDETPTRVTIQNRAGDMPFSSSIGSGIEHVDVATGALSVQIPIISRPGRGINSGLSLRYNGKFLVLGQRIDHFTPAGGGISEPELVETWKFEVRPNFALGWQTNAGYATKGFAKYYCSAISTTSYTQQYQNYLFTDASGAKHPFAAQYSYFNTGTPCPVNDVQGPDLGAAGGWVTLNASGGTDNFPFFSPDGSQTTTGVSLSSVPTTAVSSTRDANGNTVVDNGVNAGSTDSLGRTLYTWTTDGADPNVDYITTADVNGNSQVYTLHYGTVTVNTSLAGDDGASSVTQITNASKRVLTQIDLPNGTHYYFEYEPNTYGGLTKITLPTGGSISYTYATAVPYQKSKTFR